MKLIHAYPIMAFCGLTILAAAHKSQATEPDRQAEVAARGKDVMPFDLKATTHLFSKDAKGGVQQVVAKNPNDSTQIRLIREHLQEISSQFSMGDFSGPTHIHGTSMPGLGYLKKSGPGEISITYQDLAVGGQIRYVTSNTETVTALHRWFDAQLSDHGTDAREVRDHRGMTHE